MLSMPTFQISHPVLKLIQMKADYFFNHAHFYKPGRLIPKIIKLQWYINI